MSDISAIDLLWTGGWDSTFRLLDLVFVQEATVQPWYVIDEERPSSGREIRAMLEIRLALAERNPDAALRILPTRYRERASIPPNPVNAARRERLAEQSHLGSQYAWLANFAAAEDVEALELSVHRDDSAHVFLEPHVESADTPFGTTFRLRPDLSDPDLALFEAFRFPLLHWTKPEMARHAAEHGFAEMMDMTWFCHAPKGGDPCGLCGPCGYTIDEGLQHRIPVQRRVKRRVRALKRRLIG